MIVLEKLREATQAGVNGAKLQPLKREANWRYDPILKEIDANQERKPKRQARKYREKLQQPNLQSSGKQVRKPFVLR
jgi:hypothetical protein